jgi:hypothetical protein
MTSLTPRINVQARYFVKMSDYLINSIMYHKSFHESKCNQSSHVPKHGIHVGTFMVSYRSISNLFRVKLKIHPYTENIYTRPSTKRLNETEKKPNRQLTKSKIGQITHTPSPVIWHPIDRDREKKCWHVILVIYINDKRSIHAYLIILCPSKSSETGILICSVMMLMDHAPNTARVHVLRRQ